MEAAKLGERQEHFICPTCTRRGGFPLDKRLAESLMHTFFVRGSIPPEVGGPAPIYEFNPYRQHGEILFGTELDADLEKLARFLGVGLFHYGPALWRLGYTEHYQQLNGNFEDGTAATGTERRQIWQEILGRCRQRQLSPGTKIFRVRRGTELVAAQPHAFDTPPASVATAGRYESASLSIFYGAEDVETCLHEARVTLADWITVGTLTPTRDLRVIDLSDVDDSVAKTPFESVRIFLDKLAFAGPREYELSREMAREISGLGADGFVYVSYFAQAHSRRLQNIALFGHPVNDGTLRLESVNRVHLRQVSYEYDFGPHNDLNLPIDADEMQFLAERATAGHITFKQLQEELEALIRRRSEGPR